MVDRDDELKKFLDILQKNYTLNRKKLILISGFMGSGKSLFLRRGFYEFLTINKNFNSSAFNVERRRILFCTNQTPITSKKPFNAFYKIFREMFEYLQLFYDEINQINYNNINFIEDKNIKNKKTKKKNFTEEIIDIIIEENCFHLIRYLELILKIDLLKFFEKKFKSKDYENNFNSNNSNNLNYAAEHIYTFNKSKKKF